MTIEPLSPKRCVQATLHAERFEESLPDLARLPARQVINFLISSLCNPSEQVKWRAVVAMGFVVARLADADMESARVVMRRLMWNLNDESGGIGWGSPEAMGEIMALHDVAASEYLHILLSYIQEDGNLLENDLLERGALWGLARVAEVKAHLLWGAARDIARYLDSGDAASRALAARALELIDAKSEAPRIEPLLNDPAEAPLYLDGELAVHRISDIAARALQSLKD